MKIFYRIPLYLGLAVFVITVLLSAAKVGQKKTITSGQSQASFSKAALTLRYTSPDIISVSINSQSEIAGVDVVLSYDKYKIKILPSSLSSGQAFVTTGGNLDENDGTFSFSALAKEKGTTVGVIATMNISKKINTGSVNTSLNFVQGEGKTAVIDKTTGENILSQADNLQFNW